MAALGRFDEEVNSTSSVPGSGVNSTSMHQLIFSREMHVRSYALGIAVFSSAGFK